MNSFDFIINIIEVFMIVYFVPRFTKPNSNSSWISSLILFSVLFILLTFSNINYVFDILSPLISIFILIVYLGFYSKSLWLERVFASVFAFLMILVTNFISLLLISLIFNVNLDQVLAIPYTGKIIVVILSKALLFGIYWISIEQQKKRLHTITSKYWVSLLIILILSYITSTSLYGMVFLRVINFKQLEIVTLAVMVLFGFIYVLFITIQTDAQSIYEKERVIFHLSIKEKSYEEIYLMSQELKKLKHDHKHIFTLALKYLDDANHESLRTLLSNYIIEINKTEYIYCGHSGIDSILNAKAERARQNGIEIKTEISTSNELDIDEIDLAILLGNLLDNAIENIDTNQPMISVQIKHINDYLSIHIKNTIENSVLETNPHLETHKNGHLDHGYGLKSIKSLIYKYDGNLQISETDHHFIVTVLLKLPSIPK